MSGWLISILSIRAPLRPPCATSLVLLLKRCIKDTAPVEVFAALVTAVVLAVSATVSFAVPQVKAANGPCDTGDWAYAYINVRNGEESNLLFSSEGTNSIDGMSYDRESNTLTLNNYKSMYIKVCI